MLLYIQTSSVTGLMSTSFKVHDTHELLDKLNRKIYNSSAPDGMLVVKLRDALADVHNAVLLFMQSIGYVDLFRRFQRLPGLNDALRALLPPPSDATETRIAELHHALSIAHDVTANVALNDGIKYTSAQREFMRAFYTLQLRALEAAWRCIKWTADETLQSLTAQVQQIVESQAHCVAWRKAWARETKTVYGQGEADTPHDMVTAWLQAHPQRAKSAALQALIAESEALTEAMTRNVEALEATPHTFARQVDAHVKQLEQMKSKEIGKLSARTVPIELEVLSLNNFVANVRDQLSRTPELNLFF